MAGVRGVAVALAVAATAVLPGRFTTAPVSTNETTRLLVLVSPKADVHTVATAVAGRVGGRIVHEYSYAARGFDIALPKGLDGVVALVPGVTRVMQNTSRIVDRSLRPLTHDASVTTPPRQVVPPNVARVGATTSSARSGDGKGVVDADIAILDSGIDSTHADLNVVGGVDCTDSYRPVLEGHPAWHDVDGHGTFVAGIAAAKDNAIGVVGVAPGARLWAVKVLESDQETVPGFSKKTENLVVPGVAFADGDILCGLDWVAQHASVIDVANMSIESPIPEFNGCDGRVTGGVPLPKIVRDLSLRPLRHTTPGQRLNPTADFLTEGVCRVIAANVPIVAAVGNGGGDRSLAPTSPQAVPSVINVSALTDFDGKPGGLAGVRKRCPGFLFPNFYKVLPAPVNDFAFNAVYGLTPAEGYKETDDTIASFSNYGSPVDLIAPGICAVSTAIGGGYATGDGTSYASPAVAGAAALIRSHYPGATPAQISAGLVSFGSANWNASTDRDKVKEPLLDVTRL